MSRADTPERLLSAAIRLGVARGVSAMSLQGIASAAGVSKALVLYHFGDKAAVLTAVADGLGARGGERLHTAAAAPDALKAWYALAREELRLGELALLAGLAQEPDLGARAGMAIPAARGAREVAATRLAASIYGAVGLEPRVPLSFLGRMLVRHLDGLAVAAAHAEFGAAELEAELDTFAIALLGFGR